MNQKRTTKQAFVLSVLSLMLCFCMLIGSTFAWFTDSVSSDRNTIVAGNLDIELEYYKNGAWTTVQGKSDIFNPNAKWEPGYAEVVYLKASNLGDLALKYALGVNIAGETAGRNVRGESFKLSDYIMFDIIEDVNPATAAFATRDAAIAATQNAKTLQESVIGNNYNDAVVPGTLAADEVKYVALVLWMPTTVGNEANYMTGTIPPSIDIGVSIVATQNTVEADSFGTDFDALAGLPNLGTGSYTINPGSGATAYPIEVRNSKNAKIGSFDVPAGAVEDNAPTVDGSIEEVPARDLANFTVEAGATVKSYNVEVTNIKDGNTEKIKVGLRIADAGTYIDPTTLVVLHDGTPIDDSDVIGYNANTGYVTFLTTSFSPYDVIFTVVDEPVVDETLGLPQASIIDAPQHVGVTLPWGSYGQWSPDYTVDADPKLEAAYVFTATDDADDVAVSPYRDWYCDFYVSLDRDLGENQIFLGGNYGVFGWVGFHNGTVTLAANEEIGLLGAFGAPWTYNDIYALVGEFTCGVGDVDNALSGATFKVVLRLTNPNTDEQIDLYTVTHTFQ